MDANIIFSASIIASFFAGMVALFAPCCITILLPAYMASVFKKKAGILKMTFVFFAGISAILIPIGLGAAWLAKVFQSFHQELYIFGGMFMIFLAAMSILGKSFSIIPMAGRTALKIDASDSKSVFLLGVFSGAATSCCAPVLAGAMTLAVLSGAFSKALIVIFAYVFGMTFPLFIAGYFYDKFQIENSRFIKGKIFEFKIGVKTLFVHSTNLFAAFVFLTVGIILLIMAFSGNTYWSPLFQAKIGETLNQETQNLLKLTASIPDLLWGILIAGFFFYLAYKIYGKRN
ncbi:MAG: hypothetical protein A2W71_01695 [Candidatus Nealsonbacteria bacterium RIFCSPLOWO2_02_39_8]|uniref:Cytochrome C biogenesis protein transmembrane domain-containing protein n=2 Tax=Parcubacteria group TaxID=1794811 RepID=A0A1G2EKK9_9BACT|nr:MAG: hypothetical protein A2W71_01695 [Candidatus Nealsonbacteria bacterium RIFCSPLOWO2_02_39_8]OGZ32525.1 MAG: hypothetical protein A3H02_00060 [Candidatus Niyogibacteria bacterium RIFCSPLOWO2_12_FULL_41_13]